MSKAIMNCPEVLLLIVEQVEALAVLPSQRLRSSMALSTAEATTGVPAASMTTPVPGPPAGTAWVYSKANLLSLCLTSKVFLEVTRPVLYNELVLPSSNLDAPWLLARTLSELNPSLGELVKGVCASSNLGSRLQARLLAGAPNAKRLLLASVAWLEKLNGTSPPAWKDLQQLIILAVAPAAVVAGGQAGQVQLPQLWFDRVHIEAVEKAPLLQIQNTFCDAVSKAAPAKVKKTAGEADKNSAAAEVVKPTDGKAGKDARSAIGLAANNVKIRKLHVIASAFSVTFLNRYIKRRWDGCITSLTLMSAVGLLYKRHPHEVATEDWHTLALALSKGLTHLSIRDATHPALTHAITAVDFPRLTSLDISLTLGEAPRPDQLPYKLEKLSIVCRGLSPALPILLERLADRLFLPSLAEVPAIYRVPEVKAARQIDPYSMLFGLPPAADARGYVELGDIFVSRDNARITLVETRSLPYRQEKPIKLLAGCAHVPSTEQKQIWYESEAELLEQEAASKVKKGATGAGATSAGLPEGQGSAIPNPSMAQAGAESPAGSPTPASATTTADPSQGTTASPQAGATSTTGTAGPVPGTAAGAGFPFVPPPQFLNSLQAMFPPGAVIQDLYMQGGAFTMGGGAAPGAAAGAATGPAPAPTAAQAGGAAAGIGGGPQTNVDAGMGQPPDCVQG